MIFDDLRTGDLFTFVEPRFSWQKEWFIKIDTKNPLNVVGISGAVGGQIFCFQREEIVKPLYGHLQLVTEA